jgi:hypothetical protein
MEVPYDFEPEYTEEELIRVVEEYSNNEASPSVDDFCQCDNCELMQSHSVNV